MNHARNIRTRMPRRDREKWRQYACAALSGIMQHDPHASYDAIEQAAIAASAMVALEREYFGDDGEQP